MVTDLMDYEQAIARLTSAEFASASPDLLKAKLGELVAQLKVEASGATTLLYGGEVNGVDTSEIGKKFIDDPSVRVIDKTDAAKVLQSAPFRDAVARAHNLILPQLDAPEGAAARNWLSGDPKESAWAQVSRRFAAETVGEVRYLGPQSYLNRIFAQTELAELIRQGKITAIEGIPLDDLRRMVGQGTPEELARTFEYIKVRAQVSIGLSGLKATMLGAVPSIDVGQYFAPGLLNPVEYASANAGALEQLLAYRRTLPDAESALLRTEVDRILGRSDNVAATGAGGKSLRALGQAGLLLGLVFAIDDAKAAHEAGDTQRAVDIMGRWSAEMLGSTLGEVAGVVVAGLAVAAVAAAGVTLTPLVAGALTIAAALLGGIYGADAAAELYQLAKNRDDNGRIDLVDRFKNLLFGANAVIGSPLLADLNGERYTIDASLSRDEIVTHARNDIAWRYALRELNPFVVTDVSYDAHNADGSLDLYDPLTGQGSMTEMYLQDRAAMLMWKSRFDQARKAYNYDFDTQEVEGNWDFVDLLERNRLEGGAPLHLAIDGRGRSFHDHQIVFGSKADEKLEGAGDSDHLYGAAGKDTLSGKGGDDYLEGGQGDDIVLGGDGSDHLIGGSGADMLVGGAGSDAMDGGVGDDRYLYTVDEIATRQLDVIRDGDGQGLIGIGSGTTNVGVPQAVQFLRLSGWNPIENQDPNAPKRYTNNAGFTLTVAGRDLWTLSGEALPTEATLRLSSDKTLSLDFGRAGSTLEIKDWSQDKLGIHLEGYTAPAAPAPQLKLAEVRDLALLQVAAGIDLFGAIGTGQASLISRLTSAPTGSGTADRLTPAQAQYLLSRYDVLVQVGNDGSGFSATVFRRKPALDAQGQPTVQVDPYVVAFRGNDYEPHRAAGLAKDGGLGAMMEINREGFAFGQLDAMQRFWAGLAQGKVMNRAGELIDVGAASGAASSRNLVIGSGVGAHLAAAFTLLHPGNVSQAIGFDGPGLGGASDGAGGSRAITGAELQAKLARFVLMMANRSPSNSFTEEIAQAGGAWMQKYLLALETDRPNEAQFSGYYNVLTSAGITPFGPGSDTYQAAQGWENFWDGANIYHSQFYQFIVDWLARDSGSVGSQQIAAAWAALTAPANRDGASGQFNTNAFNYPANDLGGAAAGKYTSWSLDPDRLDPSTLLGGQGYGGVQRSLWVEDTLGISTPQTRTELEQQIYERGWGTNTASRPTGSPGNLTRLLDGLELASLFQTIDERVGTDTFARLQRATSRARDVTRNPRLPVGTTAWDSSVESRDADTLERSVNALSRLLLGVDPQLKAAAGPAGVMNAAARAAWSAQLTLLNNKVEQLKANGARLSVVDLTQLTADQIAGLAGSDNAQGVAVRWALAQGQAWAIVDEAGKLYQGVTDPRILQKPEHSGAAYTHQWIDDRSAWLVGLLGARTRNMSAQELKTLPDDKNTTGGWEQQRWSFSDAQEGLTFTFKPTGSDAAVLAAQPESFTRFGRDDEAKADHLTGGDSRDWLYGQGGSDFLVGRGGSDVIEGGAGADQISAGAGNDIVTGGRGNDVLRGEAGEDAFEFNRGDGNDLVFDRDTKNEHNTLRFGPGIVPADLSFALNGSTLTITVADNGAGGGSITLQNFNRFGDHDRSIVTRNLSFADGSTHDLALLMNHAPQAGTAAAVIAATERQVFSQVLSAGLFSDVDSDDKLSWSVGIGSDGKLPAGLGFDPATRTLSGLLASSGAVELTVTAIDRVGARAEKTVTLQVAADATPPVVAPDESQPPVVQAATLTLQAQAGQTLVQALPQGYFSDPDLGDTLFVSAALEGGQALPDWVGFDTASRTFTITPDALAEGQLRLTLTAVDAAGLGVESTVTLDVSAPDGPVAGEPIPAQSALEDEPFSFELPADAFAGAVGATTLSATLAGGAALPSWLKFDAQQRRFTGVASDPTTEPLNVAVTAQDGEGRRAVQSFEFSVAPQNDAPALTGSLSLGAATQGQGWTWTVPANAFVDAEGAGAVELTVQRADGSELPDWLRFDPVARQLSGTPGAGDVGDLALQVIATDADGIASTHPVTLNVANVNDLPLLAKPLADVAATEDAAFVFEIPPGSFTDGDRERLTVGVTRADGSALPVWLRFEPAAATDPHLGRLVGTPDNAAVGPLELLVTARDASGASASDKFVITVANVNDAPAVGSALPPVAATAYRTIDVTLPLAAFADVDGGDALHWQLQLADGRPLPAWLHFDSGSRRLTGRAVNADIGVLQLLATVIDRSGLSASQTLRVDVASGSVVNQAPTVAEAVGELHVLAGEALEWQLLEGSFVDGDALDPLRFSASAGDGSTLPAWLSFDPQTRALSGQVPAGAGSHPIRLTATDREGASVSQTLMLLVEPVAGNVAGTDGNDSYNGTAGHDRLDGRAGNDGLNGLAGHDMLLGADGADTLSGGEGDDRLLGGPGDDRVTGGPGHDMLSGGVGIDWLWGDAGNDMLHADTGGDALIGGSGSDTYLVSRGSGHVEVRNGAEYSSQADLASTSDVLRLVGIGPQEVTARRVQTALELDLGGGDSVRLPDYFEGGRLVNDAAVDLIRFDDGTRWQPGDIAQRIYRSTEGSDSLWGASDRDNALSGGDGRDFLYGDAGADTLSGDAGNDYLSADDGDDSLTGGEGVDFLSGGAGNDTLRGGPGDDGTGSRFSWNWNNGGGLSGDEGEDDLDGGPGRDYLAGGPGSDIYRFGRGYGHDTVEAYNASSMTSDKLGADERDAVVFNADVSSADIVVRRNGLTLELRIAGTADQLDIDRYFANDTTHNDLRVDDIRFADGTVWTGDTIRAMVMRVGEGSDRIQGYSDAAESIDGGSGDDTLEGRGGNDSLSGGIGRDSLHGEADDDRLDGGADDDQLDGGAAQDALMGGDGADLMWGREGDDLLLGGAGNDGDRPFYPYQLGDLEWSLPKGGLYGGAGNDTLDGGAGSDILVGGPGSDVYRFARGGGQDMVYAYDYWNGRPDEPVTGSETDALELGPGITPADVIVQRRDEALVLELRNSTDTVTIEGYFRNGTTDHDFKLDLIRFADGTTWDDQAVLGMLHGQAAQAPQAVGTAASMAAVEDEVANLALPANLFNDADGDLKSYRVRMAGGGALPSWIVHQPPASGQIGPGTLQVKAENAHVGPIALQITAVDRLGFQATLPFTLNVQGSNDAPTVAQALAPVEASEDQPFSVTLPAGAFVDIDAGDDLSWSARRADGSPLPAWLQFDPVTRVLSGTPDNVATGQLPLSIQATDSAGASVSAPLTIHVAGANDAPMPGLAVPALQVAAYQVFSLAIAHDAIVDPDMGDTLTRSLTLADGRPLPGWLQFDPASSTLRGRAVNADAGRLDLRLSARDRAGLEASVPIALDIAAAAVNNAAPLADSLPERRTNAGAPVTMRLPVASFRDADPHDPLVLAASMADGTPLPDWLQFDATSAAITGLAPQQAQVLELLVKARDRDGATVTRSFRLEVAPTSIRSEGTAGNDTLNGSEGGDVLIGQTGDDYLRAGGGGDVLAGSDGNDVLEAGEGNDSLIGGDGKDSLRSMGGNDDLIGGTDDDTLYGDADDDTLDGGPGDDLLYGGSGADTYLWGPGDGHDRLDNGVYDGLADGVDMLQLEPGLTADDLVVRRIGDRDLQLSIRGGADTLLLSNTFSADNRFDHPGRIERLRFADGSEWTGDELLRRAGIADGDQGQLVRATADRAARLIGSTGNDELRGDKLADTLEGGAGRDRLFAGQGNDLLAGGDGDDGGALQVIGGSVYLGLFGEEGDDTIDGGAGDDRLQGGAGNDTYLFGRGSGRDTIENSRATYVQPTESDVDTLRLGPGIGLDELQFVRIANNLEIRIRGSQDVVTLEQQFDANLLRSRHGVDRIVLDDGTEISPETVAERIDPAVAQSVNLWGAPLQMGFEDHDDSLRAAHVDSTTEHLRGLGGNDRLDGNAGVEFLFGGAGNDTLAGGDGDDGAWPDGSTGGLWGEEGDDVLRGGPGVDYLRGGRGNDTYVFERGDGIDRIANWDQWRSIPEFDSGDQDVLRFGAGIAPADVFARKKGDAMTLLLSSAGDEVFVWDQFRSDAATLGTALHEVRFADGTIWRQNDLVSMVQVMTSSNDSYQGFDALDDVVGPSAGADTLSGAGGNDLLDGGENDDRLDGGAGNDSLLGGPGDDGAGFGSDLFGLGSRSGGLYGGTGDDLLDGGPGSDYLEGGEGADTFQFTLGSGRDVIADLRPGPLGGDTVLLGAPLSADNLRLDRRGSTLILQMPGDADAIEVPGYFDSADGLGPDAVVVRFPDGSQLTAGDIRRHSLTPTEGDDVLIFPGSANDAVQAGGGNDRVETHGGDDRILGGDGADTIHGGAGADEIDGDAGIDRIYGEDGNDWIDAGPGDDSWVFDPAPDVYAHVFNGVSGGADNDSIDGGAGRDILFGDAGDDLLRGGDGDDGGQGWYKLPADYTGSGNWVPGLYGGDGNDTLEGGAGTDNLSGGLGNDTYRFGRGDGRDSILDRYHWQWNLDVDKPAGESDVLVLEAGISPQDVQVRRASSNLVLSIIGTSDEVVIESYFWLDRTNHRYRFETIRFADGTQWTLPDILARAAIGTSGPDNMYAAEGMTTMRGLEGNDYIAAGHDSQTWNVDFDGGDGNDTLRGHGGNDKLAGGAGNDELDGGGGHDVLDGEAGNDAIYTGSGNDVVVFGPGYGSDTVAPHASGAADTVVVRVLQGIDPAQVVVRRSLYDLQLTIEGVSDRLLLSSVVSNGLVNNLVDRIEFADNTVWTPADLARRAVDGTAGNDRIYGLSSSDLMQGREGDDDLYGSDGDDTLDGGAGNDTLVGEGGRDLVLFGRGSGNDVVQWWTSGSALKDLVRLGAGIDPSDVELRPTGSYDLTLLLHDTGEQIRLPGVFDTVSKRYRGDAPEIEFADGTVWNGAAIEAAIAGGTEGADARDGTPGNDSFTGRGGNDTLRGLAGADTLDGGTGADSLHGGDGDDSVLGGDGADMMYAEAGNDRVLGGADNDTVYAGTGDDFVDGGDGADSLTGEEGADTLDGGPGNDSLFGGAGHDTFVFGLGDGQDSISWSPGMGVGEVNTLRFEDGVQPSQVSVVRVRDELHFELFGTTDSIAALDFLRDNDPNNTYNAVQRVVFGNGTVWDLPTLVAMALAPTTGPDSISGTVGADSIAGIGGNDTLLGRGGDDTLHGGDGADSLAGDAGNDSLVGGAGNDSFDGGEGNDTFTFNRGDGQDVITYSTPTTGQINVLQFGADIAPEQVAARQVEPYSRLELSITGTDDKVTVDYFFRDGDTANPYNGLQQVRFADGTSWNLAAIVNRLLGGTDAADSIVGSAAGETISGGAGADTIYGRAGADSLNGGADADSLSGEAGDDTLDGGTGNDMLEGGEGNNTYVFGRGDGQDTLNGFTDSTAGKLNRILFRSDVAPGDVTMRRLYDNGQESLEISIAGTTDKLTVRRFFYNGGPSNSMNPLQQIGFGDGTVWDLAAIAARNQTGTAVSETLTGTGYADALAGGGGNDSLFGLAGDDTLAGELGADTLRGGDGADLLEGGPDADVIDGGAGNDTYVFGCGDGQDTIAAFDEAAAGRSDTLVFKSGVVPGDVIVSRSGSLLVLAISGTADRVTVEDFFVGDSPSNPRNPLQQVRFPDGTVWNVAAIVDRIPTGAGDENDTTPLNLTGSIGGDTLYGNAGNDTLRGGAGDDLLKGRLANDSLYGEADNDTLDGGAGNDTLDGSIGNNTYVFGRGDGQDVIQGVNDSTAGKLNTIEFRSGVAPSDVIARRIYDSGFESLELSIVGTTDRITARNVFNGNNPGNSYNPVQQVRFANGTTWNLAAIQTQVFAGTADNDSIAGTIAAEAISGQAGADTLYGRDGNDSLTGGDGNDSLYGEVGADRLDGGTGNDTLDGGLGNNIYVFGRGEGQDVIQGVNDTTAGKLNTIEFRAGVVPGDVVARRIYDSGFESLELSITGSTDKITARYFFSANNPGNAYNPVQQVRFANGTTWNLAAIRAQVFAGTSGNDSIAGTTAADTIRGQAGDDTLYGRDGNDTLYGGDGNDMLFGESGADRLDGGTGNETLDGGIGNNTYVFGRGDGQDVIQGVNDTTAGKLNTIELRAGVVPGDMVARRVYDSGFESLELAIAGSSDRITARYFFSGNNPGNAYNPVQRVRFADGTIWNLAAIQAQVFTGTSGNDSIAGTIAAEAINGQAGADTLYGRDGNDSLTGGDGNDSLYGEAGADRLDGGAGNDALDGGLGNNTYVFGRGDGQDVIQTAADSTAGKLNTIDFREGVTPSDVVARRVYDSGFESLELAIAGGTDKITARYFFSGNNPGNAYNPVQQVRFADGTTWDLAAIQTQVFAGTSGDDSIAGTIAAEAINGQAGADTLYGRDGNDSLSGGDGNDLLYGEAGADRLDGGAGNDTLHGGAGGDTYAFGRGSGADVLVESDATAGNQDLITFGSDIAADQLWFRRLGTDLEISVIGGADKLTLQSWYAGSAYQVESLRVSNGQTLLNSQVDALVSAMAGFAPPPAGQTTLPASYQPSLLPAIAANWSA